MPDSSVPTSRPHTITAAFWCWVAAAVLTAAQGLWLLSQPVPLFFLLTGGLLVVVGLAQGYLAGQARRGKKRFGSAAVGLALASVLIFILLILVGGGGIVTLAVIMILLVTGSAMNQRDDSQQWYDSQAPA
jgi:ABC-type xylose transport system permease subunit